MKRFMLFTWDTYYPRGGLHDLAGTFDSVEEAVAQATKARGGERSFLQLIRREKE